MLMLILETFVLMLISALLGSALGRLFKEAFGPFGVWDEPWLREGGAKPPAPVLPAAPTLLDAAERARLKAAAEAVPVAKPVAAPVAPAPAPVAEATPAPAPAPVPAPAPAAPAVRPTAGATPPPSDEDLARAAAADAHGERPAGAFEAHGAEVDDLEIIKGIGPQNHARLNALGIWSFAQIAAWTPENAKWVGSYLAFVGRIEREDWIGQAKALIAARKG